MNHLKTSPPLSEVLIYEQRSLFMQQIADYVGKGYLYFVQDSVKSDKAAAVLNKLVSNYQANKTPKQTYDDRAKGIGSTRLLAYWSHNSPELVDFVLLHNPVDVQHLPKAERWHNATDKHTRIQSRGYELLRQNRSKAILKSGRRPKHPYSWTWQYAPKRREEIEKNIERAAIRQSRADFLRVHGTLCRTLGFSVARTQAIEMLKLLEKRWRDVGVSRADLPAPLPERLPTVRRMTKSGITLADFAERLAEARAKIADF